MNNFENNKQIKWLLNSGVNILSQNEKINGGVFSSYNLVKNQWDFIYSEITGYAVSVFSLLYKLSGDDIFLQRAKHCSNFLLNNQLSDSNEMAFGSFIKGLFYPANKQIMECYSFDNAMIIQGLLDFYNISKDPQLLDSALKSGNWLIKMQKQSGQFYSYYNPIKNNKSHPGPFFYQDFGCLHAKHAIALLKLYKATGEKKFESSAKAVCDWVLSLQNEDGAFWVNQTKSYSYAHAHCYTVEGLLYAYDYFKDNLYLESIIKSIDWLKSNYYNNKIGILGVNKCSPWFIPDEQMTKNLFSKVYRTVFPRKIFAVDATIQFSRILKYSYLVNQIEDDLTLSKKNNR